MKRKTLFALIVIISQIGHIKAQDFGRTTTNYSKIENGSIGEEIFDFSLKNGTVYITNYGFSTNEQYGPLKLEETGYNEEGDYYTFYMPDIKNYPLEFTRGKELRGYNFIFDKKGGDLLFIDEMKIVGKSRRVKTYYTTKGYSSINKISNSNEEIRAEFDIRDVIIKSESIAKLMGRINFSFEQTGEKNKSTDGKFITVRYDNKSNVTPLVTYENSGEIKQIIFLVPKYDAEKVVKELISEYGTTSIDNVDVIKRGNLIYDYRAEGSVGMIIIYEQ